MWLSWQIALRVTIGLTVAVAVARSAKPTNRLLRGTIATAQETALCFGLYTIWQYTRSRTITKVAGAHENAMWVWDLQQAMHLPSEAALQQFFLDDRLFMQAMNVYYGGVHVPAMGIALVWLFFRHRGRYPAIRNTLALLTAGCITLQMIPVAPPRFLPELGFVDSALLYNQSVYGPGGSGISNQVAAMPSLHVGWSLLVAYAAITIGRGRWRWLVVLHPLLTILAVTVTANHWWLDGVVAAIFLVLAIGVQQASAAWWRRLRPATSTVPTSGAGLVPAPAGD